MDFIVSLLQRKSTTPKENGCFFPPIPQDILNIIVFYLDPRSAVHLGHTCAYFYHFIKANNVRLLGYEVNCRFSPIGVT